MIWQIFTIMGSNSFYYANRSSIDSKEINIFPSFTSTWIRERFPPIKHAHESMAKRIWRLLLKIMYEERDLFTFVCFLVKPAVYWAENKINIAHENVRTSWVEVSLKGIEKFFPRTIAGGRKKASDCFHLKFTIHCFHTRLLDGNR